MALNEQERAQVRNYKENINLIPPKEIKKRLDEYVIGQEEAKKTLSVAIYNHYKRLFFNMECDGDPINKSNIIICGNSGSGKTFLVKTIASIIGVPCYIADCTKLTESGYVGSDVETVLTGLLQECNYDVKKAEMGIVLLDEIDKIAKKGENPSLTKVVGCEGVQQSLLKIVEGDVVGVPPFGGRKHPEQQLIDVNTENILFIGLGAFVGLEDMISERFRVGKGIGFTNERKTEKKKNTGKKCILENVIPEDLKTFGLIPEMIGRFPIITHTNPLTKNDLVRILTEPKNSIVNQYRRLLSFDEVDLSFEDSAIGRIAEIALEADMGARGLRHVMEKVLMNVMYDFSGKECDEIVIDRKYVVKTLKNYGKTKAA